MSLKWGMSHAKNVIHNFPKTKKDARRLYVICITNQ